MAKRTNPFVEDFIPQSKTHIGIKQFNNTEVRLQRVYEKTLLLLFKGAKKPAVQATDNTDLDDIKKDKMKQLFIGKDGRLLHTGSMVHSNIVTNKCCCGLTADGKCAYCEVILCCGCQHCCELCRHPFCSHCSLIGLDGTEVCVSCYG